MFKSVCSVVCHFDKHMTVNVLQVMIAVTCQQIVVHCCISSFYIQITLS